MGDCFKVEFCLSTSDTVVEFIGGAVKIVWVKKIKLLHRSINIYTTEIIQLLYSFKLNLKLLTACQEETKNSYSSR